MSMLMKLLLFVIHIVFMIFHTNALVVTLSQFDGWDCSEFCNANQDVLDDACNNLDPDFESATCGDHLVTLQSNGKNIYPYKEILVCILSDDTRKGVTSADGEHVLIYWDWDSESSVYFPGYFSKYNPY